jgi:hypothetical protein
MGKKKMTKERKKALGEAIQELQKAKDLIGNIDIESIKSLLESSSSSISDIAGATQEEFDNMSENKQQGDKGQRAEEIAEKLQDLESSVRALLDDFTSQLSDFSETLDEVMGGLEECIE